MKMKIGKNWLCLAFALSLSLTGLGGSWTENGVTFNYTVSDGEACVSITSCGDSASVVIPSEIDGNKVTSIGETFSGCRTKLASVVIPNGVTNIGMHAFWRCDSLTAITIPDSVTSIGNSAFSGCKSLASIKIPDSVTSIGVEAFSGCDGLADANGFVVIRRILYDYVGDEAVVTIPDGVRSIGSSAFSGCRSLVSITIPNGVTNVGSSAFWWCSGLTSVTIPNSVTSIGTHAFVNCTSLESLTLPNSVTNIGKYAFADCSYLTTITMPDRMTSIGDYAFRGCSRLSSITIPDGVTRLGENLFQGCSSLMSATIPNSVTSIGLNAFNDCTSLTSIEIPNSVTNIDHQAFWDCSGLVSITLPDGLTSIEGSTFSGCSSLASITIPGSVTNIGWYAFTGCSSLTAITIPVSVTDVGQGAFSGCSSLTSVTIPDGVTSIGRWAFSGCSSLVEVMIPDSVTSIGGEAFKNCSSLTAIALPDSGASIGYGAFSGCSRLASVKIPDGQTSIGSETFKDCSSLVSITIPDSVTSIADSAFKGCTSLVSITIPDGVTTIGASAFEGCTSLASINIPNSVTTIGASAFKGCTRLASITIPDSVTRIGDYAFKGCDGLSNSDGLVIVGGILYACVGEKSHVTIPGTVTKIGTGAFEGCDKLTAVTISEGVKVIGNSAFYGCKFAAITIPSSVTNIGEYAFYYCSGLTSITIPDSVTSIGAGAFEHCDSLVSVEMSSNLTTLGAEAFKECGNLVSVSTLGKLSFLDYSLFEGCSSLESVTIPESVTYISYRVFAGCWKLTDVSIPSSVTDIGSFAFAGCGITRATLPAGLGYLQEYAFAYSGLTSVTIPGDILYLERGVFSGCYNLTSVKILPGVGMSYISESMFEYCPNLTSIALPDNVISIYARAFSECSSLVSVGSAERLSVGAYAFSGCSSLTSILIPYEIEEGVFQNCGFTRLVIPDGTASIPALAFKGCANLESVTIPASVTEIDESAFSECPKIKSVRIDSPEVASQKTLISLFQDSCSQLTSLTLGEGVTELADGFFDGCDALMIAVDDWRSIGRQIGKEGVWVENGRLLAYVGEAPATVEIPADVTTVSANAFAGQATLESVRIPASVTGVGDYAFSGCAGLKSVEIDSANVASFRTLKELFPASYANITNIVLGSEVTALNSRFFNGCEALLKTYQGWRELGEQVGVKGLWIVDGWALSYVGETSANLEVPYTVTNIASSAFADQTALETVGIYESVTNVSENAFAGCDGIRSVTLLSTDVAKSQRLKDLFPAAYAEITNIVLHVEEGGTRTETRVREVTALADGFFEGCVALMENIRDWRAIGEQVGKTGLWVENDWALGYYDATAEAAAIPSGVMRIADRAFADCEALAEISIPSTVTNVGSNAFSGCAGLKSVRLESASLAESQTLKGLFEDSYANLTDVALGEGITVVADGFFGGCEALTSIALPSTLVSLGDNDVRAIGERAGVEGMWIEDGWVLGHIGEASSVVEIPSGVKGVAAFAFEGQTAIETVVCPDTLEYVGKESFAGCASLPVLILPASVSQLGSRAFADCTALQGVFFMGDAPTVGSDLYEGVPPSLVTYVGVGSRGWDGDVASSTLPATWPMGAENEIVVWESLQSTATFKGCGGEPDEVSVEQTVGETYRLPQEAPTRLGATFAGWWTERDAGVEVRSGAWVVSPGDGTLYAHWRMHGYTVSFDANGGNGVTESAGRTVGVAGALPKSGFWRVDHDFAGWAFEPDAVEAEVADGADPGDMTYEDGATVTLYAVWRERKWTAADCLNAPGLTFVSTNDAAWFADGTTCHDGVASMRSGVLGTAPKGETVRSTLKTSVRGNGTLSFWWKVACEPSVLVPPDSVSGAPEEEMFFDYLEVTVDGVRPDGILPIAGALNDWAFVSVRIEGDVAEHEVCWSFVKDDWDEAAFADVAWVDEVTWTPDTVTVSFDAGEAMSGAAPSPMVAVSGSEIVLPAQGTLACPNCRFVGWSDGVDVHEAGEPYVVVRDGTTLTAVWEEVPFGEAVNDPGLTFARGGDAEWQVDFSESHDGTMSLRSGAVARTQESWIETTVANPGALSFWWKADGFEYRGNPVNGIWVEIDGVAVTNAAVTDWANVSVEVTGMGAHTVRWTYRQTWVQESGEGCAWLDEVVWTPIVPVVEGDADATVTSDAENGYVITPSKDKEAVVVTIPSGVDAANVTVKVSPETKRVTPNGATVRVVRGEADITDFLDIPAADASGIIDLSATTVKEEIAKAVLSVADGAELNLSAENPTLTTAETKPDLKYQLYEGATLSDLKAGDSKIGDGSPWTPKITEKGGSSGFYTIQVTK